MPLTRYQIRNEYSLADPELYKAADKDDPEAVLEGVAMAGLVGVLRQLGDLAEFAAEIFHDLHEEVMATASRGHGLVVRVQQLEAEVPSIEKAFLSQTNHSSFFASAGFDWHPNLQMEQNLITRGDLPRCVMDSYEECRGPPRLFLLDKFDVAGAGACLKRYTDPSFFKVESAPSEIPSVEIQREKKIRKVKKKGSRWRNGEMPETVPTSHAKLHQLFLEEKIEKGLSDPARLVKLKKRQLNASPFDSRSGKSYMEKFLETTLEHNVVREISVTPLLLKMTPDNSSESGLEIHDISTVSPVKKSSQGKETSCTSPDTREEVLKPSTDDLYCEVIDRHIVKVPEPSADGERDENPYSLHEVTGEKEIVVDEEDKPEGSMDGDNSYDMTSEVDNYMDALTTMESEMEIDNEYGPKIDSGFSNTEKRRRDSHGNGEQLEFRACSSDSQSTGNFSASDDGNSSFKKGRSSFSYSDTLSNLAENTQSDGEGSAKAFPSEASVPEIKETPSNQVLVYAGFLQTSHDLTMPTDMCTGEDNICDCGEASGEYADIDSNAPLLLLEPAEISLQQKLDDTPSETMRPVSELLDIDERRTNLADPSAVVFDMSSQNRNITLSTVCAESHPLDMLDGGDPNVSTDVLLHLSNDSKLVPEKKSSDDSSDEVLLKDIAEEDCPQNMVNIKIGAPKSISSPRKEQSPCSALPEVEACSGFTLLSDSSDFGKLDDVVSEADETLLGTGVYLKSSTSVMNTSESCSFKEQQASDVVDNNTLEKPVLYSRKANLADTSGSADSEKIGVSTCKYEAMEGDVAPLELPSSADSLVLEDHVRLDDVVAEIVQAENMTLSTTATDDVLAEACADDRIDNVVCLPQDIIYSSSNDLVNLQEFPSGTEDPDDRLESNELISPECLRGSEAEKEMTQPELAPKYFEYALSKMVSCEESNLEMVNGVHNLSLADTIQNGLSAGGTTIPPASSEVSNQEMESKHPLESCLLEDGEDGRSSPADHLSDPDTSLEQSLELQADRLDVKSMTGEASSDSPTHLSEQVQSSNNGSQEILLNDESCQEHLSSQPLPFECLRQSTGQETNNVEQEMGPLGSVLPSFGLLHEATQVHLEKMPPLPPLPPMQWIIGKIQQAPLVSQRDFTGHSQESFPSMLPFGDHEKAQSGFPSQQRGFLPSFNPFLPISAVEVEKFQHVSKQEEGNAKQPALSSLQLPCAGNDANSRKNNLAVEETQSLNPFLTLLASSSEEPEHGFLASEHEVVKSSLNPFLSLPAIEAATLITDPVSSPKKLVHPLNQLLSEPGLKDKTHQQTLENSEGEHLNPSDTSVLPPLKVEEQPQRDLPSAEGETLQLTPENSEGEHANPSDTSVLPPRKVEEQPQHDFLSSEGKALQHTPENSEVEHANPFDMSVLPPRKVEEQPQQGLPSSEGEILHLTPENSEEEHVNHSDTSVLPPRNVVEQPQHDFLSSEGKAPRKVEEQPQCDFLRSEGKALQHTPENSEGEHVNTFDKCVLPPRKVEEQPQQGLPSSEGGTLQLTPENSEGEHVNPFDTSVLEPRKVEEQPQHGLLSSGRESAWPSNPFALLSNFEVGKENGSSIVKLPRPRNPLIDAVAAHDKSKLRKVTERIRPQIGPKVDERDSLLEQIRTQSFNLKPAVATRPNIQGPKTNLRVAAILEKANAIRQATAGSDEDDDDDDSWSDS